MAQAWEHSALILIAARAMDNATRAVFSSKVDGWLAVLMVGAGVFALAVVASTASGDLSRPSNGAALAVLVIVVLLSLVLPIWLLLDTSYSLSDEHLKVRSGPFRWALQLASIDKVQPSRSALSAPALSLDRIRIDYGARSLLISPRERQRFVDELRRRCPNARIAGF